MRPAELTLCRGEMRVGLVAVRAYNAAKGHPQHVLQCCTTAPRHPEERGDHRCRYPQVALLAVFAPGRFIDIRHRLCLDGHLHRVVDRRQRGTDRLIERRHTAQTDGNVPQVVQQQGELTRTQAVTAMEQGDERCQMRPKTAGRHLGWTRSTDGYLAVGAGDGRELVLGDGGLDRRNLPDLLAEDGPSRGHIVGHCLLAVWTAGREMHDQVRDLIRRQEVAVLARMLRLRAPLAARRCLWGARGRTGGITRRRTRRVAGVLVELGFKLSDAGLQRGELLLEQ